MDQLWYLCLVFVMLSHLFIAALWSPAGKGLTSWFLFVMLNCGFITFPCCILGQVLGLIVSIPVLCRLLTLFESWLLVDGIATNSKYWIDICELPLLLVMKYQYVMRLPFNCIKSNLL